MSVVAGGAARRALQAATAQVAAPVGPTTPVGVSRAAVATVSAERCLVTMKNKQRQDQISARVAYIVRRR